MGSKIRQALFQVTPHTKFDSNRPNSFGGEDFVLGYSEKIPGKYQRQIDLIFRVRPEIEKSETAVLWINVWYHPMKFQISDYDEI